jgi:beta-glucosidase/6-phospho-beta-glucosidase/beta-galactosidase
MGTGPALLSHGGSIDMKIITGFESTYMPGVGTDVLEGTRHNERFRHDFELVKAMGIDTVRYPASWNYVEAHPGQFDWSLLDRKLEALAELNIAPILDLVHHTALPDVLLPNGFADADFRPRLVEFAARCAERYPWITQYTVFNEPYLTTQFCGELGIWFPFQKGGASFVAMLLNVCRAIIETADVLRQTVPGVQLMHPDTCERHVALDPADAEAVASAAHANERRFLADDILTGRLDDAHPFYDDLLRDGATEEALAWFLGRPSPIDIRGLDYYRQSEWEHLNGNEKRWSEDRQGFAVVARDYIARLGVPIMLSETNYFGPPADRARWLDHMLGEYRKLAGEQPDMRGFCWFPFISSTDFQHMLLEYRNDVDPVGIYDLGPDRWDRIPSELVDILKRA